MIVIPRRNYGGQDDKEMHTLIDTDQEGPWAIRYLWIQHTKDNEKFYNNYFDPALAQTGMNVRKQTANLKQDWAAHNQIFFDSAANGNLVWRVKVGNPICKSIDYVEIWRSADIIKQFFSPQPTTQISEGVEWHAESRKNFNKELFDNGFDIRSWVPYNTISKIQAMRYYQQFVEQWRNKDRCIINTPWNRDLNPL
jgi:hypothetical protein